jgi:hypothetical protein
MTIKPLPSAEYLRQCFEYDSISGTLTWRSNGEVAGYTGKSRRYTVLFLDGRFYRVHRIIWKMQTSDEPPREIDHRNGDPKDNRWANLRAATRAQNIWNSARNTPGKPLPKGVFVNIVKGRQEGRCFAMAYRNGRRFYLGRFNTAAEADAAYRTFTAAIDGEFHHPD